MSEAHYSASHVLKAMISKEVYDKLSDDTLTKEAHKIVWKMWEKLCPYIDLELSNYSLFSKYVVLMRSQKALKTLEQAGIVETYTNSAYRFTYEFRNLLERCPKSKQDRLIQKLLGHL